MIRKSQKGRRLLFGLLVIMSIIFTGAAVYEAQAAENSGNISLRIIATGDLHGQITAMNYETNEPDEETGFSKIATLIRKVREEVPDSNSLLLDAGDFLYDYGTNFFYDNYPKETQPILKVMEAMGYDYITLGNHELDYPWDYVKSQLMASGLYDKVIVSNLFDSKTGENVFDSSVLLMKKVEDDNGNTVRVKIGIVAATRKGISTRRGRNSNYLYADEIYTYVSEEAQALREKGADIVIALIHGGTGILSGSDTEADPGERLTKLSCIDAVITSHSHEVFPDSEYEKYSNVDLKNGLVNGKPLVATGSHASGLGVINFELSVSNGKVKIKNASAELQKVTADIKENAVVTELFAGYKELLDAGLNNVEYDMADGEILSNIDCMIADNELYQLINNAKLEFAKSYISEYLPEYLDYPLIAVTANYLDNKQDYIVIEDTISKTDVASILAESSSERDNGYVRLCKITGKNLREWLEFCASFYYVPDEKTGGETKDKLGVDGKYTLLINPAYDEREFFAFDGICYEIDVTKKARYSATGGLIAESYKRVTSLTYNGEEVKDDQVFIVALDSYNFHYYFMPTSADTIYSENPWKTVKDVILEYLERETEFGPIDINADNNWSFKNYKKLNFLFSIEETGENTEAYIKSRDWYIEYAGKVKKDGVQTKYYTGKLSAPKTVPAALTAKGISSETGRDVPVYVELSEGIKSSKIAAVKYIKGYASATDTTLYKTAVTIQDNTFYADENGIYTICIRDTSGKRYFEYVVIDNINKEILDTPQVNYISNRLRKVTGRAVPNTTVYVQTANKTYKAKVSETGSFSVTIDPQKALETIQVWISDGNKESSRVSLLVRRTGANQPEILEAEAGQVFIKMRYDEENIYFIQIGDYIYLAPGTKEDFINSESYSPDYTIIEKPAVKLVNGSYYIMLPKLKKGDVVNAYCVDWCGRTSPKATITI